MSLKNNELDLKGNKIERTSVRDILHLIQKCHKYYEAILTKKTSEVPPLKKRIK
jgi:hypothetical protein